MVSAKTRSQKIIRVTAKLYSSRKPSRPVYRKKLNRLTRYRRRELFRAKHNRISALLSTTRPYLRAATNHTLLRKQRYLSKKSAPRKYLPLPAGRAKKLTKARIISALLRRKRYQYKKLTYQLLKARRLQWLRATREKTLRLNGISKSAVRARTPRRTAQTARVGYPLRRKITLLLRARRFDHPNRSKGLKARRPKGRFRLRRSKRRPLKLRRPRGRYLKLQLRRKLRRRSRKLRLRVNKRSSRRNRRKLLIAASQPVRQHLYYRRLVRTQRAGASIQRLRALRPTLPSTTVTKALSRRTRIEQSWHSEMVQTVRPRRATTSRKRVLKGQKVGKSSLPTTTEAAVSTVKSKLPKRITVEDVRNLLRKSGERKFFSNEYQRAATTRPLLKSSFIGPLTRWQLRTRAREARRRSRKSLTRRAMAVRATPKKFKRVKGRSNASIRRWSVRPFLQANLQVKPSASAALTDHLFAVQSLLRTSASKLNHLKQIKRRKVTARKIRRNRRATMRVTKLINRLTREQGWLKVSSKKNQPVTAPRHISAAELRRTIIAATTRTPSGRRPLIRRYLEASRLPHVQLYDLRPRVDHAAAVRLPRKSSRRKRYLVKRRRTLVAKIKRKLRRRRSRQRVLTVKKRKYQFTPRSPVHAGQTVTWKGRGGYRYQLYRKLEVTHLLFKRSLRVKRPVATIPQPAKEHTLGRSLLWALLQFVTEAKSSTQDQLVTRLSGTIRRILRRNFTPAAPLMRLLLLKAFTLATTTTDLAKKMQLLVLERRWLSATTARSMPLLRKKVSNFRSKKRITIKANLKSNRYLQLQPIARRGRSVAAAKRRLVAKILHLKQIYRKGVKRLLPRRKLIIRLRLLKPKRWHTKKTRARLKRRRITAKLNWRRLHQYRQARLFVTHRAQGRLQGQLRDGARHRARLYSFAARKAGRWSSSIRRTLQLGLKTGQRSSTLKAAPRATRLQRQRLLVARLDSLRLRARKALLWKAPLQPHPAAGELNPLFTREAHWHADPITLHPAFALTQRQELRRSVLTGRVVRTTTLAPAHFGQRGQAIRIRHRALLPAFTAIKFSKSLTLIKKIQSRGRLSRIGRAAFRPRRLNFRTKQPYFSRKKARAKKAPTHCIRALRRVSFRKNRFFMRRLSTAGYRVDLLGKLLPKRTIRPIINRPLRTSMRRRKPLRRSLRRRLAKRVVRGRNSVRLRKVRSSTGRILSKLKSRFNRSKKRWRAKKSRKAARSISKRVGVVNTLLDQLEQLAALRTRITAPKQTRVSRRTIPASIRRRVAIWRGATPARLLLRAPRRISRLRRLRRRITIPTSIQRLRSTTLQSKTTRRRITPLRRKPKKKLFRSLLRVAKKHRRKHRRLRHLLRRTLQPTSRRTLLRALLRTLPELTPGKYRWLRRRYRRRLRRVKRTPALCIIRKGASYKLRVASSRPRLPRVTVRRTSKATSQKRKLPSRHTSKVITPVVARSLQKLLTRHKALAPSNKKWAKLKPQPRKLTSPGARSKSRMNFKETKVPATASPKVSAVPARARPSKHPAKKTPAVAPTVVVSAPLLPAPDKKIVSHSRQIKVKFSTPQLDKKISQFNKEPNIFTEKAYVALMSGVKFCWTALGEETSTFPKAQRESEATDMERLYKEFYGVEPVRGNPKSLPDFKQYDANRKAAQSTSSNNKN